VETGEAASINDTRATREHHMLSRLTTIKLALRLVDRHARLGDLDHRLLETALEAVDQLAVSVREQGDGAAVDCSG
jgi:hypothetical protein